MLSDYMRELEKIKLLTPEEERDLWRRYHEEGDEEARMSIIEHYQPLVFREAMEYRHMVADVMDCVQEGTVGLMEAIERYDETKGVAFSLYAVHRIRGRIVDFIRKEGRSGVVLGASPDEEEYWWERLPDEGPSTEATVEERAYQGLVTEALAKLPAQERRVMEEIYMADRAVGEVAGDMETSHSYIYRLHRQGIKRLRGILSRTRKAWRE